MKKGIATCMIGIASFGTGFVLGGKMLVSMINDYKKRMQRNLSNMMLFNDWLEFVYSGGHIEHFFHSHGYKKIIIYGNGYIGQRLCQAIKQTDIEVEAIMDKNVTADNHGSLLSADSEIPDVDCIVITPVYYYDEIYALLNEKTDIPVVSMQVVIRKAA